MDLLYVGTYNAPILMGTGEVYQGNGQGIHLLGFDGETGTLLPSGAPAAAENASFLLFSPDKKRLFAVNELAGADSAVSAFSLGGGTPVFINRQLTGGAAPCHLAADSRLRLLFAANYTGGSISVFPIRPDGSLAPRSELIRHEGCGVNPARQEAPHVHSVLLSPDETCLFSADLGLDRVFVYEIDYARGKLSERPDDAASLTPGCGPRSLALHPGGTFTCVTEELGNAVTVLVLQGNRLIPAQRISTLPGGCAASNLPAEAAFSPDGRYLYVSNRGHDSIAVFSVDISGASLSPVQWISTCGRTPRSFTLSPDGSWLFAANQDSDTLCLYRRDADSGRLTFFASVPQATPVCVRM